VETQLAQSYRLRLSGKRLGQFCYELANHRPKWRTARYHHFKTDTVQLYDCRIALERLSVTGACQKQLNHSYKLFELSLDERRSLEAVNPSALTSFRLFDIDYRFICLLAQSSVTRGWFSWIRYLIKMQLLRIQTTKNNPNVLEIRN